MISSEPPGLSWEVIQRLESLKFVQRGLEEGEDAGEQLSNVNSIIAAYRSGQLQWHKGPIVTYWSRGVQLCEPKEFSWDDFERINKEHDGWKAFWVEGVGFLLS